MAGDTAGPLEALGRNSLSLQASLLGSGGWDNSARPSVLGAGLSQLLQEGAAQAELAGSLAGRLLEGNRGHMVAGSQAFQDSGSDSSMEHVGKDGEVASVHMLGISEVQTAGTLWT